MSSPNDVILVTGGNTGLGLEIVKALCESSSHAYTILIGSRSTSKAQDAIKTLREQYPSTKSTLDIIQVDLASDTSIQSAIDAITSQHGRLDVLVNNAGAQFDAKVPSGEMSLREMYNLSWDTNVSGAQVLTTLAVPLLLKSSNPRLIFMTSGTSTLAETESTATDTLKRLNASPEAGWPKPPAPSFTAYRSVKCGLNMVMREWTRILGNDGVKVFAVSPGMLATNLGGAGPEKLKAIGAIDPSIGAHFVVDVVEGKRDSDAGKAIRKDMIQPW